MVYPHLDHSENIQKNYQPSALMRGLSFVIDYFIFAPIISFVVLVLFRSGLEIFKQFPKSDEAGEVLTYIVIGFVFLVTVFQALFITFMGATPGQYFLKLRIDFRNQRDPIFFQAWLRQLGFVLSFVFLGLPFLKILSDRNAQAFYEKMTDSLVVSLAPSEKLLVVAEAEQKFWSASLAALNSFFIVFLVLLFWINYKHTLTSPTSYAHYKNKLGSCAEFVSLTATERLRYSVAMNLAGTLSDDCLDQEADFVLWRNQTDDRSLAYFAKFVTAKNPNLEKKYLKQACIEDSSAEGCFWSTTFQKNNFSEIIKSDYADTILASVVSYETLGQSDAKIKKQALNKIANTVKTNNQNNFKSIKKFLIVESMNSGKSKSRMPASSGENTEAVFADEGISSVLTPDELRQFVDEL